jgi:hypothetical protein
VSRIGLKEPMLGCFLVNSAWFSPQHRLVFTPAPPGFHPSTACFSP